MMSAVCFKCCADFFFFSARFLFSFTHYMTLCMKLHKNWRGNVLTRYGWCVCVCVWHSYTFRRFAGFRCTVKKMSVTNACTHAMRWNKLAQSLGYTYIQWLFHRTNQSFRLIRFLVSRPRCDWDSMGRTMRSVQSWATSWSVGQSVAMARTSPTCQQMVCVAPRHIQRLAMALAASVVRRHLWYPETMRIEWEIYYEIIESIWMPANWRWLQLSPNVRCVLSMRAHC